jgi:hypothetical protein
MIVGTVGTTATLHVLRPAKRRHVNENVEGKLEPSCRSRSSHFGFAVDPQSAFAADAKRCRRCFGEVAQ